MMFAKVNIKEELIAYAKGTYCIIREMARVMVYFVPIMEKEKTESS